jgi:hypothetical protein
MDYKSLGDFNPDAAAMKAGAVARFPGADGFVFSHIAVNPNRAGVTSLRYERLVCFTLRVPPSDAQRVSDVRTLFGENAT